MHVVSAQVLEQSDTLTDEQVAWGRCSPARPRYSRS